jgi:hypothetical protein
VHFPKLLLQPVPQWPAVLPQKPYWLQQVPKTEPVQVKPFFPPQVASVEAFLAGAADAVAALAVEAAAVPVHVPKALLQPVEQKSVVLPHHPY